MMKTELLPNVELHIEELILHGFAPGDRHRIGESIESELARLFAEQGVPPSLMQNIELERVDTGSFSVAQDSKVETVGAQVAQMMYGGLSR